MSTPCLITCICGDRFMFLRNTLTTCPKCGEKYTSHRDWPKKSNKQNKADVIYCGHCGGIEGEGEAGRCPLCGGP